MRIIELLTTCLLFCRKETVPLIRDIPGLTEFQGPVQHSHDFRTADRYKDQSVLCIGSGPSAMDISGIVAARAAKQVKVILIPKDNVDIYLINVRIHHVTLKLKVFAKKLVMHVCMYVYLLRFVHKI